MGVYSQRDIERRPYRAKAPTEMMRSKSKACAANRIKKYRYRTIPLCPSVRLPRSRKASGVFLLCKYQILCKNLENYIKISKI